VAYEGIDMAVEVARRLFSLEEYNQMINAGVFHEDEPIELIRGEVIEMAAIGPAHRVVVGRIGSRLQVLLDGVAHVWVQNPIDLPELASSPGPDILLLKWRDDYYAGKRPTAADVLLIIEVADTTLMYDRKVKAVLYAEAGIREMWLVNLKDDLVEVYSQPVGPEYKQFRQVSRGGVLALPGGVSGAISADDALGEEVRWEEK
jgi:Uma2 family endonuclease